jgi:carboxymethylenebutenolidase
MSARASTLTYPGPQGPVNAHLVRPDRPGPWPGILLLHEGLGVTAHLLGLAERFARLDHVVLVPDLYTHEPARATLGDEAVTRYVPFARAPDREQRLRALAGDQQAEAQRVLAWFDRRNTATYLPDARAGFDWLRRQRSVQADAIAAVGFSQGGGLVAELVGAGAPLAAGVVFYGQLAPAAKAPTRVPILGHSASDDPGVTPAAEAAAQAIRAHGDNITHLVYADTAHGFFNPTRPSHHPGAAALAWERSLAFLQQHLRRTEPVATT